MRPRASGSNLSRKLLKAGFVTLCFLLGESLGIVSFIFWLQNYEVSFKFSWPLSIGELIMFYYLAVGVLIIPVALAETGSRAFDRHFKNR